MMCISISLVFFFFKQKTAYEMRISDWSSDVCSSDLRQLPVTDVRRQRDDAPLEPGQPLRSRHRLDMGHEPRGRLPVRRHQIAETHGEVAEHPEAERKSVVEGKSVAVRVEHGGRRIIKTK